MAWRALLESAITVKFLMRVSDTIMDILEKLLEGYTACPASIAAL